jgi:hypothetical protein
MIKTKSTVLYDTDDFMKKVWKSLVRDFRTSQGHSFCENAEMALNKGMKHFRSYNWPDRLQAPIYTFKCLYQLESFYKRYIFINDAYSLKELEAKGKAEFAAFQAENSAPDFGNEYSYRIMQRARSVLKRTLGPYDPDEHAMYCRFGKRAAVGVPMRESYLDITTRRLTGSKDHITWFERHLEDDRLLSEVCSEGTIGPKGRTKLYQECDALTLTGVPKSWKSYRMICPNTVLGGFYSSGLARVFQIRLENVGLDIRRLQNLHKIYAERASVTRESVTVDLSRASDVPLCQHLNKLLPREWYRAVKFGRIPNVMIDGSKTMQTSFMAMGIGYTFTLETLVFWSLLKAIQELTGIKGLISVFGDDLIYPRRMHKFVKVAFKNIGLRINKEKSYVESNFRESCGGDYYHGVDVRPAMPEMVGTNLTGTQYLAFCYKVINSLKSRWTEAEIPLTIRYILLEILRVTDRVFQVPMHFPETSGVKTDDIMPSNGIYPWAKVVWNSKKFKPVGGHDYGWSFPYLGEVTGKRFVETTTPYYWDCLRSSSLGDEDEYVLPRTKFRHILGGHDAVGKKFYRLVPSAPLLPSKGDPIWSKAGPEVLRYSSGARRKKCKRKQVPPKPKPYVTEKGSTKYQHQVGSTSVWANEP